VNSILGFFGLNVPAWAVEIVAVAALIGGGVLYERHVGAEKVIANLRTSSVELIDRKTRENAETTARYEAQAKDNAEKLNNATAAQAAAVDVLTQRVRDFDAYRRAHPDVARPAGPGGAAPVGECGDRPCGEVAVQLAEGGNGLARAVAGLIPALQACQADRDALTGLPK
jgi:hypothetical protein